MIDAREPKDGDFVAYVDRLEREFAARNLMSIAADAAASSAPQQRAQPLLARNVPAVGFDTPLKLPAATRAGARLLFGLLACVIGFSMLVFWLFSTNARLSFLIGIGLLAWGASNAVGALNAARALRKEQDIILPSLFDRLPSSGAPGQTTRRKT